MSASRWRSRCALVTAILCAAAGIARGQANNEQDAASAAESDAGASRSLATAQFVVESDAGLLTSLRRVGDAVDTQYIAPGAQLGGVTLAYRSAGETEWRRASTSAANRIPSEDGVAGSTGDVESNAIDARHRIADSAEVEAADLEVTTGFEVADDAIIWTIRLKNLADAPLEIGDLAVPLPMASAFSRDRRSPPVMKHSFISGHGSFLFWTRPGAGPYLTLTPLPNTQLEYWEPPQRFGGGQGRQGGGRRRGPPGGSGAAFRAFIHSAASGTAAKERGTNWRQPHTSVTLAPAGQEGAERDYGFKFRWAEDLQRVRDVLVDEGLVDVHVVPGMTVPSDLAALVALRSREPIHRLQPEHADQTTVESLGPRGDYQIYRIQFRRLGENLITVHFGDNRQTRLEFFATEPVETVIKKRAAFLAKSQHHDPAKWYRGLISDWNMETQVLLGPDNYDRISGFRIYAVTCDDPGLGKPAYLAAKNAEFPDAGEMAALDEYIEHFVWGGLQRTTDESYPYGIYGIQDWKRNRESDDPGRNGKLHIWRCYDYPHIVLMYHSMYRAAKLAPQIATRLLAEEYLRRAAGTAIAMFTVPREVEGWSANGTGFYNELVIVDLIRDLDAAGMKEEASTLREHWERKVKRFVLDNPDLFRSEYAFDSTGFESTHALAKYAMERAGGPDGKRLGISPAAARDFLERQTDANMFCRGTIEPAYYYLGSDYRGGGGNGYTLTYMSQMGGWSVLDYALNFARENRADYLRVGYASNLSAWALVNCGTPESNYGYWYPGAGNDGAAGGGFEPAPFGMTWLGQPHHRGSWYYACESDLGFSGGLRSARCIVTDDPIFGRICLGGELASAADADGNAALQVVPKDGLRRRFHALLESGELHVELAGARFQAATPIELTADAASFSFTAESEDPNPHKLRIKLAGLAGTYVAAVGGKEAGRTTVQKGESADIVVTIPGGSTPAKVVISRAPAAT